MKLEQSFEVAAPLDRVWEALIDVEHVAPCLPGAAVTGRNDDGSYSGSFTVKIGPTTASYSGKLEMRQVDESAHTATMHAHGSDKRGQGGATATIFSTLAPTDSQGTRVEVMTDYHITGRLARFGRGGMIEDISQKLLRQFADRLQESLVGEPEGAAPPEAEPAPAEADAPAPASVEAEAPESDTHAPTNSSEPTAAAPPPPPPPAPPGDAPRPPQLAEPVQGVPLVSSVLWDRVRRNPAPVAFVLGLLLAALLVRRARR